MSERRQIFAGAAVSRDQTHPRLADYGKPLRSAAIPARNIGGSHSERKIILLGQIRSAFVATALVASIPATTIRAETGPLENGFDLARRCESSDAAEKLFCVSFLIGVYTTAIALGELVGPPVLCPAGSVSGADILAMFENYARNNPQHLDTRPEVTALLAFRNAVGCPK